MKCLFFLFFSDYVFRTSEAMTGAAPICVDDTGNNTIGPDREILFA